MTETSRQGFSLVEVLVALAVFSLAALALLNLTGESTRSAARVEDRTLGGIVAENLAVQTALEIDPPEGMSRGGAELAGRPWRWTRTISPTADPALIRAQIQVFTEEGLAADRTIFVERGS